MQRFSEVRALSSPTTETDMITKPDTTEPARLLKAYTPCDGEFGLRRAGLSAPRMSRPSSEAMHL
ncbi:MAG TPA: hypothetical protein VEK11_14790 [Thermoanaerobaculia bacterium]|nr:hypothetical protein [Thermoanaerobaculia bacterium]